MPRIDPLLLLKTLSVLLGPDGGIKESEDVQRVVNLMVRFSKKLVSKCIYIQILLATKDHLLDDFYSHGGWDLVTGWFSDACDRENWRLLEDMLRLFKDSPVTVERLKMNHCPKQVKHLSKEAQCDVVKDLALEVVDIWMKVIKGEPGVKDKKRKSIDSEDGDETDNNWKTEIRNGKFVIKKVDVDSAATAAKKGAASPRESVESVDDTQEEGSGGESGGEVQKASTDNEGSGDMEVDGEGDKDESNKQNEAKKKMTEKSKSEESPPVKEDAETKSKEEDGKKEDESKSAKGKKREHSSSRLDSKSKRKSSDKSSGSKDKSKKSSSSKHSTKESSRHRSHKDHKERHKSRESEKQREREKEKERERKKQSEKDKETLAKVQGQSLSLGKLGAIPKKKATGSDKKAPGSSEEAAAVAAAGEGPAAAKKPLLPTPGDRRPPTVKAFGAKFRSTGLEDAVSTTAPPKRKPAEVARPPPPPPKRPLLPEPAAVTPPDKRSRFEQRPPVERPGGIKVIPPKPLHLQEASGFMDALNASTDVAKRKNPKRTRRLSSREDSKDEKKSEPAPSPGTAATTASSPPVTSPVATKPLLKFYQDTQEDKEEEEEKEKKESPEDKKSEDGDEKADGDKEAVKAETENQEPEVEEEEERAPTPPTIPLERPSEAEQTGPPRSPPRAPGQLKGVLVYHRPATRRKQSVRWRPDNKLVDVSYFDLDENERVNVNRAKFMEMQAMEKMRERDFMRRARSSRDDGMAEQMAWQMLIVVDKPPPLVAAGARSQERGIQEERERSSLPAFFNPALMPDTPAEAEPEHHERTPCKPVPLEDDQDGATVKDHSADGWPEPRPEPRAALPPPGAGPVQPLPPQMVPPGLLPPPNSWVPGGPMQPGMGGMDGMMPPDIMSGPMGMHGPGPGFGGPQRPMGPPGGWGPIGPPMGPGGMMTGPAGMMGGPGGMGMMAGPGPRPPYGGGGFRGRGGGGGGGGWRGGAEERRPRHEIPCKHHLSGYCRKGMSCHFLHLARNGNEPARGRSRADDYV